MPTLPTPGGDLNTWGAELNEWLAKGGQVFNAKDGYGATGDGTTNDTSAIQAAIDAACAYQAGPARGAIVYLPTGCYRTSAPLTITADNITFMGAGLGNPAGAAFASEATLPVGVGTLIQPLASFSGSWVIDVSQAGSEVKALACVWLRDFSIDGWFVPAGATGGILFKVFNGGIERMFLARLGDNTVATGPGIKYQCVDDLTAFPKGAFDCKFHNIKVQSPGGDCFYAPAQASDAIIANSIFQDGGKSGTGHGLNLDGPGFVVTGNYITGHADRGINCTGDEMTIVGNRLRECQKGGIYALPPAGLGEAGITIVGNSIRDCAQAANDTYDAIQVAPTGTKRGGVISGNEVMIREGTNRYRYGVNVANSNAVGVHIGANGDSYKSSVSSACVTAFVNDDGVRTRIEPFTLAKSGAAASHTGNTSETTLATVTVPAGSMGKNGRVLVTTLWTVTNNANNKTLRVKFGGTTYMPVVSASQLTCRAEVEIFNRNSLTSQAGGVNGTAFTGLGFGTGSVNTSAVDTKADVTILITGQLANSADTVTLEAYSVEVKPG